MQSNIGFEELITHTSKKNPASLKHFTLVFLGRYPVKLSQCKKDAKPPAEHPESKAYRKKCNERPGKHT